MVDKRAVIFVAGKLVVLMNTEGINYFLQIVRSRKLNGTWSKSASRNVVCSLEFAVVLNEHVEYEIA